MEIEGLEFKIIYYDTRSQEYQVRIINPPSYIPDVNDEGLMWDICMF